MKVQIEDLGLIAETGDTGAYIVSSEEECRDSVDASAYRLCVEHGGVSIKLGKVLATPVELLELWKRLRSN